MKKLYLLLTVLCSCSFVIAQNNSRADETILVPPQNVITRNPIQPSPAYLSRAVFNYDNCLTQEQQKEIQKEADSTMQMLRRQHPGKYERTSGTHPMFRWPVQPATSFTDYGFYTIQFLIDQNLAHPNQLLDYNCGTRTYDFSSGDHQGTDIIYWPYPWRKMDDNVMENVAAAAGVIVSKRNGYADHQCSNNGSGDWNGIILEHADGSRSWYLHFKNNSITTKNIGDAVAEGEYLGLAGSSGSSDWPHLHFQVMDPNGNVIDPWDGACNTTTTTGDTWWQTQQPYTVPSVNRICTKGSQLDYYSCPNPEITYEKDTFNIGDSLWCWVYTRDLELNSTAQFNIYNPSNQNVINFSFTCPWVTYPTTYVRWYYIVDPFFTQGWWKFEYVYGGQTYQHLFYCTGTATAVKEINDNDLFSISPNPVNNEFTVSGLQFNEQDNIIITDVLGKSVYSTIFTQPTSNLKIQTSNLSSGLYFIEAKTGNKKATHKLIVHH